MRSCARILGTALLVAAGCRRTEPTAPPSPRPVAQHSVPRALATPKADGRSDDVDWPSAFRSGALVDARGGQSPHAELRALVTEDALHLLLYVADDKLQSASDELQLQLGPLVLRLRPGQTPTLPEGVSLAMEYDGTVDQDADEDEEWTTELTVPWRLLGDAASRDGVDVRLLRRNGRQALAWPAQGQARLMPGSAR
jgi:hypothetical protein